MLKTKRFGLILTPDEKRAVELMAHVDDDMPQAALIRRLIRQEARRRGLWPTADQPTQPDPARAVCHAKTV